MIKSRSSISLSARGGLLFILLLAAAMPGCKKDPPPPPPPQVKPLPAKTAQVPQVNPVQSAVSSAPMNAVKVPVQTQLSTAKKPALPTAPGLDFTGKRDPFKPYAQMLPQLPQQQTGSTKRRIRDPLPIQSFDVEKFRISGIVTGLKENSALVIDPNNKGYVVKAGMPIGSNDGYVKRITGSTVEVEESFRDDNGRVRKRLVKLTLLRKK